MITENTINILDYQVLDKLPDPFLKPDDTRVSTVQEWNEQRKNLYKTAVEIQFGKMPPEPEFLDVELIYDGGNRKAIFITTGPKANPVKFYVKIFFNGCGPAPYPTIVDGDLCFNVAFKDYFIEPIAEHHFLYALFDRTQLAHDVGTDRKDRKGQLYDAYPDYNFSAIGAWAWGYSRVIDALFKLGWADPDCLAVTGHSRGGKTALLAGVLDERVTIVNPNDSGAGGCGCYRIHATTSVEGGGYQRSERLEDLLNNFSDWFSPEMEKYKFCEEKLPFDNHYLKALVAPRILLDASAASDGWANPIGTWQTTMAAKEVYKFLGKEENLIWYYRNGGHAHNREDLYKLIDVMEHIKYNDPLPQGCFITPFKKPDLIFDWICPERK